MNKLVLLVLLYFLIQCQPSETKKEQKKQKSKSILTLRTRYDTINVKDEYLQIDFQLRDTSEIDLKSGFATLYFLDDSSEIRPYRHYVQSIVPPKNFSGNIIADTLSGKVKFTNKRGIDTTINYQKIYFISKSHFNHIGKGETANGKKEGRWEFYDRKNGEITRITYFKNGLKHGTDSVFVFFGENRILDWVYNFKEGKKDGKQLKMTYNHNPEKGYVGLAYLYKDGVDLDSLVYFNQNGTIIKN